MRLQHHAAEFLVDRPRLVLGLLCLVTLLLLPGLTLVQIDPSLEGMIIDDDPDKIYYYNEFIPTFGSDEFFVFTYRDAALFSPEGLARLARIVEGLQQIDDVERVLSLTTLPIISGREDTLRVAPPVDRLPQSRMAAAVLRWRALSHSATRAMVVSADGQVAVNFVFLRKASGLEQDPELRVRITESIEQIAQRELGQLGLEHHMAGVPYVKTEIVRTILRSIVQLGLLAVAVLLGLLWYTFRSWRGVWVPLSCVMLALIWTLGLMGYADRLFQSLVAASESPAGPWILMGLRGVKLDTISTILFPLLMVVGVAHTIHLLTQYHEEYYADERNDRRAAVLRTVRHLARPCLLTSVTTGVGFASLMLARIPPIRAFGLFAALGVQFAWLISISFVPAVLMLSSGPQRRFRKQFDSGPLSRLLSRIVDLDLRRPKTIVALSLAICIVSAVGVSTLRVETYVTEFFRENSKVIQGYRFLRRYVTSPVPLEIVLRTEQGDFLDPEALAAAERFEQRALELDEVLRIDSLLDSLRTFQRAVNNGDPAAYRLPQNRAQAAEALLLMESDPQMIERLIDFDRKQLHLAARIDDLPSSRINKLLDDLRTIGEQELGPQMQMRLTGGSVLFANLSTTLMYGQIYSISLALALISLIMIFIARSLRLGLIAMIPNVAPILFGLGLLGILGFPLDTNTVMIAPIAIGIAVDDSIHLVTRFLRERRNGLDPREAMRRTITSTGRALVSTSLILAMGFVITSTSPFKPQGVMGLIGAVAIIAALAADLLLTPVCILAVSRRDKQG
ncbi:MAG: MMPL family transporter [Candidatus Alcyoniella australis]|nr:MMPL family transporter [Candidatus Alcyoniella australis]